MAASTGLVSVDILPACKSAVMSRGWPTEEDWGAHRSTIKKLYSDENRTLKELMGTMKSEYGLKAT